MKGTGKERGQAVVWVAVMLPFLLAVLGLAADGSVVWNAERELQLAADGAARSGAEALDTRAYYASNGATVALDPTVARAAAGAYLQREAAGVTWTVAADSKEVVVRVRQTVPTSFVRIVGIDSVPLSATAAAQVRHGVTKGSS